MESAPQSKGIVKGPLPSECKLLSSAKVVVYAAKATLHYDKQKVDKAKGAGAGADLLGAASHYGKLEEKSYGKYAEKPEMDLPPPVPLLLFGHHYRRRRGDSEN